MTTMTIFQNGRLFILETKTIWVMNINNIKLFLLAMVITMFTHQAIGDSNSEWESSLHGTDTFWGAATNGVRSALHIEPLSGTNALIRCTPILKSSHTNILLMYFPPLNNRFIMELQDSNGRVIAKSPKGKALNETLTEPFGLTTGINRLAGYGGIPPLYPNHSEMLGGAEFVLQDYFQITNSGKYNLTFQMRVICFPPDWKGSIKPKSTNVPVINIPAVNAQIEIK